MPIDSEKITDHRLISKFEEVFKCRYNTAGNDKLFGSKIPDGWFEYDNNLFIIENKKLLDYIKEYAFYNTGNILKVQGGKIAVKENMLSYFKENLKRHGFVLDE